MNFYPDDPTQTFLDAAEATGDYAEVSADLPQEIKRYPYFAIDPTEEEDESVPDSVGRTDYDELVDYVLYIIIQRRSENGTSARRRLDTLKRDYLTQMFDTADAAGEYGVYEKVRRARMVQTIGSDEVLMDALVIRAHIQATYE